jgi:hypothetical protein
MVLGSGIGKNLFRIPDPGVFIVHFYLFSYFYLEIDANLLFIWY